MEDAQVKLKSANNMQEAVSSILNSLTYHLLKKNKSAETPAPIKGEKELTEFKNTTYQFIQNLLIIIQQFKDQFSDTVDPILLHMYRDNYAWLKNFVIEMHRVIAPTKPNRDILSIAKSLGVSLNDTPDFDNLRGIGDNIEYAEYVRCPSCQSVLQNARLSSKVICPQCKVNITVPTINDDTDDSDTDDETIDSDTDDETIDSDTDDEEVAENSEDVPK